MGESKGGTEYAADEISQLLGVSEKKILSAIRKGLLDSRQEGDKFFISQKALKRFVAR